MPEELKEMRPSKNVVKSQVDPVAPNFKLAHVEDGSLVLLLSAWLQR